MRCQEKKMTNSTFNLNHIQKTPCRLFLKTKEMKKVREAIDSIDNEFTRELLENRFLHEMSFEQIAEHMCIENNSTLRVTIRRGKKILAEILKDVEKNLLKNIFSRLTERVYDLLRNEIKYIPCYVFSTGLKTKIL